MGVVIHIDSQGGGGSGTGYIGVFLNYNALIAAFPTAPTLSLAYVQNSQGTKWLPGGLGGNFYSKGSYLFDGVNWVSSVDEISEELQNILDDMNTQDLASVLLEGFTTGARNISIDNGQVVKATNGSAFLDLRQGGVDGNVLLENSQTFLSMTSFGVTIQDEDFFQGVSVPSVTLSNGNQASLFLLKGDFTKTGGFAIRDNETLDIVSLNLPNYPATMCSQNSTLKQNVINAIALCGKEQIVKTDDYPVLNGIAYNTGLAGELIVVHTPSATDFTQTHQAKDGTIALTSDIPKAFFAVNLDSAESSISRVFAGGRTTFTVTHNLNTLDLKPEVFRLSDGRTVGWRVERTGVNTVEVSRNGNIADGLFRILI